MSHPNDLSFSSHAQALADSDLEEDTLYSDTYQQQRRDETLQRANETIAILTQRLNEDIARLIVLQVDLLDTWRERRRPSSLLSIMELNSPQPCFIGSQVPKRRSVRQVDFRLESHDQGWTSSHASDSWSWFTVCVLPTTEHFEGDFPTIMGSANDITWSLEDLDSFEVPGPKSPYAKDHMLLEHVQRERELCRNTVACRDFELHKISWSADSEDADESSWVRSLKPGERILVRAWAQYPRWSNNIRSVSVTLHTTILI